ncbi:MAG: hypothetical protein Q9168_001852 [Polycauliona sp. 1 TL-2023]
MPGPEYVINGPDKSWDLTHDDADTLLCAILPPGSPEKYKIIFTVKNAGSVLQHRWTKNIGGQKWEHKQFVEALVHLNQTTYKTHWATWKNSMVPEEEDRGRQERASISFKKDLQAAMSSEIQVVRLDRIPSAAIKRLCAGLRSRYNPQDVATSLEKLFRTAQLPKSRDEPITPSVLESMQLYLCASDNEEYDKWMAIDEKDPALRSEHTAIGVSWSGNETSLSPRVR